MAGVLGGDLVGMSTTLETIAAREAGLEVLGISLVTNLAAGISPEPLHHAEVLEAGREAAPRLRTPAGRDRSRPVTAPMLRLRRIAAWLEQDPDPQTRQRTETLLTAADGRRRVGRRRTGRRLHRPAGVRHRGAAGRARPRTEPDEPGGRRPGRGRAGDLPDRPRAGAAAG